MECLLFVGGPGDQGRPGVRVTHEARVDAGEPPRRVLLVPDQLLKQRQPLTAVFGGPGDAGPAAFGLSALPGEVVFADTRVVARARLGRLVLVEPRADLVTELQLVRREVEVHDPES